MTIAAATVIRIPSPRGLVIRQAKPSTKFFGGWLIGRVRGSALAEVPTSTAPNPLLMIEGVQEYIESGPFTSSATTDSGGGAVDPITLQPQNMRIVTAPTGWFDTGTSSHQIKTKHIGLRCYAFDNNTLYLDDLNGQLPDAGIIDDVKPGDPTTAAVRLRFDPRPAAGTAANFDGEITVRCVITALSAFTESAGTITVTATGALGAQDGLTVAPGDLVWLPEYAGTANSSVNVNNAKSGFYEVLVVGTTGVQPVLTRPAFWPDATPMPLGASFHVAEGTLFSRSTWDIGAAKGSTIGTTDPSAYPREVIQQSAMTSSALVLANVPIRDATRTLGTGVLVTAGGTTTSTVDYRSIVAATPGPIGTATITIAAIASGGGKNGTADTSTINASIRQV